MKRTLTSTVGVFVTIALVAAFFSPSPALARGSEPGSSGSPVSADVSLRSGTVLQDRLFRESSLLPAYFLAYGLDASDLGTVGLRRTAAPSRPVVVDGQLDSMALPVHINGSDMPHERDAAVESWAHESPDIASAAYYTPTLKTVSGAGTVVFTNTLDDPFTVTIWLTSAFNDEITLAYSPAPSGTIAACAVGHQRFNLGAYKGGLPIPYYGFSSAAMALVTIQYADSDVVGLTESELALRYWNPQSVQWQDAHRLCEPERSSVLDTDRNTLTVSPCSLSYFPGSLASFYGEPTVGPSPLTVVFTNTSFGDVNEYLWAFGDGVTSSTESPTHTYTLPGVYTVTLTASNGATNTNTLTRTSYITAYEPAVAGFVATPLSGERPLTVTFTNTSTGSFSESYWQFGDGNVSSTQSPTHTYAAAGVYTVSLRVSGIGGTDTVTRTSYITVDHMTVFADFVGAPTSGPRPLTVAFTNTSTGDYDTSAWTFGDGGSSSSTNPSYTYTAAGTYTVTLTVDGPGGTDAMTRTSYITVAYMPVSAAFSGSPLSGPAPLNVDFSNTSTGDFDTSDWDFGDGGSSTETYPSYTYTVPGVYTVTLTASGLGGSDTYTRPTYVTVYEPVAADFEGAPTSGERPLTVDFTNLSTGAYSTSVWTFGDGGSSTSTDPTYTYTTAGVYTVTLTVNGPGGTDTLTRTSYITAEYIAPVADFEGAPTSGVRPLTVAFTNTSTGDYDTSAWTFGDGGSSSSTNPSYTYTAAGTYTVTLTVSGLGGSDTHTETSYITVAYMPVSAAFSGSPTSGVAPLNVDFSNTSTGDFDTSDWDFGDGGSSTVTSPSYTYTVPGVYTVTLTASGLGGADTLTRTSYITVYEEITADFVGSPTSGERPLTVVFTNTSTGDYSLSSWDFGDISGMLTDQTVVTHTYDTAGVYTVTLTSSGVADSDTVAKTSYITVSHASVTAGFIGSPTSGERPLTVVFTNTSTGDFSTSSWDFGDGITSSVGSPTHTYTTAGVYTVSLTVSGLGGADNLTRTSYISVSNVPVAAVFTGTPTLGVLPLNVNFTNGSTGDYTTSAWDFGDGGSSTETSPSYTYTTAGIYTVTLTVSGPGGTDTHTRTSYITALEAGGTADIDPTTSGTVVFTTSTGSTLSFLISNASVAVSTTLVFAEVPTTTVPPSPFLFGNIAFVLEAFVDGVLVPHYTFLKPVALTVNYTDADVQGLDENTLRLYYWDETTSTWADIASTCTPSGNYLRYPGYNQLTVSFCHLCTVGLAEGPSAPVHLPIVVKE
jgi:PKD repeat protein